MPKPKPDNVVRHEIVLGRAEREIIRDAQVAYSINRITSPFTGMSTAGFALTGATLLFLIDYVLDHVGMDPNWREIVEDMTPDQVNDWLETQNLVLGGIGAIIGLIFGGPVGAGIGGVVGGGVAEVGEAIIEEGNARGWTVSFFELRRAAQRGFRSSNSDNGSDDD